MLAVERDVKPQNVNFPKLQGGGGGGGRLIGRFFLLYCNYWDYGPAMSNDV